MQNRGLKGSLLAVALMGIIFLIVWASRDTEEPAPVPVPGPAAPSPPPPPPAAAFAKLSRPPTQAELAQLAARRSPAPEPREARQTTDWPLHYLRQNIAEMVGEGRIERVKSDVLGRAPEQLEAALDAATTAVLVAKHAEASPADRCLSAWLLGKSGEPGVSAFLAGQIASEGEVEVRIAILTALQNREDEEAGAAIARSLGNDASETVREAAAYALASRAARNEPARRALLERLSSPTEVEAIRSACATALGEAPCEEAESALVAALGCDRPALRLAAAWALSSQTEFVDPSWLTSALESEPEGAVKEALRAAERTQRGIPPEWPNGGCTGGR